MVDASLWMCRGLWRACSIRASQMAVRWVLASLTMLFSAAAVARGSVIYAKGTWAAIDRGSVCEALARSTKVAPKDKVQATAGLAFTPDHRRWGEFHAQLSRMQRPNSSVMLIIEGQQF